MEILQCWKLQQNQHWKKKKSGNEKPVNPCKNVLLLTRLSFWWEKGNVFGVWTYEMAQALHFIFWTVHLSFYSLKLHICLIMIDVVALTSSRLAVNSLTIWHPKGKADHFPPALWSTVLRDSVPLYAFSEQGRGDCHVHAESLTVVSIHSYPR